MEAKHASRSSSNTSPSVPHSPLRELVWFSCLSASIKLLLVPSYRSTDFEVHRNWLAITHSAPLTKWYFDTTSPWTLDYPPFFAYFELLLSLFASLVDPTIVDLHRGLNYEANSVIYFQRISVILSDLVLHYAIYRITQNLNSTKRRLIWFLVIFSPGLIIVDHMHFQYNGFLLGLLLLSIAALREGNDLIGGFLFAVLLCFKHLFAVEAPVYFVYLLRHCCRGGLVKGFTRLLMMGSVVASVFAAALGPFLYHGHWSDTASHPSNVSFWSGAMPCLFGSKFLGFLHHIRQVTGILAEESRFQRSKACSFIHWWAGWRFFPIFYSTAGHSLDHCYICYTCHVAISLQSLETASGQ